MKVHWYLPSINTSEDFLNFSDARTLARCQHMFTLTDENSSRLPNATSNKKRLTNDYQFVQMGTNVVRLPGHRINYLRTTVQLETYTDSRSPETFASKYKWQLTLIEYSDAEFWLRGSEDNSNSTIRELVCCLKEKSTLISSLKIQLRIWPMEV